MLLRELNVGAGKRSRRKGGHFGFPEVLFGKIREARGERLWKRTLFSTLYSQYFGYRKFMFVFNHLSWVVPVIVPNPRG
jgi:hypothetical protein